MTLTLPEVKRAVIKDSVKVHRKLGTKYAVETALGSVFPGTEVTEWFEYGGAPYLFKVVIDITNTGLSQKRQAAVLARVKFYKNLRSHLESIYCKIQKSACVRIAAVHKVGTRLEIAPYLTQKLEPKGDAFFAGCTQLGQSTEIYPLTEGKG